jgi:hypothetical protein
VTPAVVLDRARGEATVGGVVYVAHHGAAPGRVLVYRELECRDGSGRALHWVGTYADGSVRELPQGGRTSQRRRRYDVVRAVAAAWLAVSP